MRSFARGVELASRVGAHGRLMNAARAMHTLARSPSCGLRADPRLAKNGGAGLLAVAAARLVEHLEKLRVGTVDESPMVAVDGGAESSRAPVDDEGDRLREERRARIVEAQPPSERDPPPSWFADRPGVAPEFCLRFVVTAAEACAAAGMNHGAIDLAVGIAEALGTADAAAAAMPIAVAAARDVADSLPDGMLEGLEKSARAALGARAEPVAALADARALASIDAAEYARRGPATRTLRRAGAEDLERNFSLFWNGIDEPESIASTRYFGAEVTLPPWKSGLLETGKPSTWKPPVGSAPLAHGDAVEAAYARAVATARTGNDAGVIAQALLELGDFEAASGHPRKAASHWSACVDQITGCYRTVTTAGASALPGDPEACLRRYGLWGCLRGAQAAARLASLGSVRRSSAVGSSAVDSVTLGNGHRIEAARISAALFAAPFASTLAHSPRAVEIVSGVRIPPAQLWDGVDAHGSDPFGFDARTSCDFATAVGELLVASGRSLEALPPLAVAEHLAAHALRDARACARVRCAQAAALAGVGRFDVGWEKIDGVLAGDSLPSTSTGPDGGVVRDESGAVVTRNPWGTPENRSRPFDVAARVTSEANKAAIERIAVGEMPDAIADAYGEEVCAELSLVRARWLVSLATPLAVWRGDDADAVTGEPIGSEGGSDGSSVDADVRDDVLARAEEILTRLAESTTKAVAEKAAAEQERIEARRAKAAEAREAREAARAEKEASEKAEREAAEQAEKEAREKAEREEEEAYEAAGPYPIAVKKPPADDPDATGAPGGGSDAENADPNAADGTGRDGNEPEDVEGSRPLHPDPDVDVDVDVDEEDVVAEEVEEGETRRVISPWLCATPSQMSILARAKASLAEVLRARNRPRAAFDEASASARELEAVGDGTPEGVTPNGAAAAKARDALRAVAHVRGSHALWLDLRAECALCLLELGHLDRCRELASSCAAASEKLGATDHVRLFEYVAARAAATAGDVDTALASYASLLREMTTPREMTDRGRDGSPPPPPSFLALVAGTTAELLLRLGDEAAAEAWLEPAIATTRAHADALGLAQSLRYPDARSVHNPVAAPLVGLLLIKSETLVRRGGEKGSLARARRCLDEAASLCGSHTAATDVRTHATIAMLRGHVARMSADATYKRSIAEASLTRALAWACSGLHDRRLIRACLLELARLHVPAAEAEAAGVGEGEPAASPDDAKATARVVACLRHAAKAAKMRDAFEHESRFIAEAASSTKWPAGLSEAVEEEEAARDAGRGHAKLDGADAAQARLAVASFVRLVGRLPAIGFFAPGSRSAREVAAATHSALADSCDAYKQRCCFAETPALPPGGDVDPPSGWDGDGAAREGSHASGKPAARVVEIGAVHAQWIEPASEPPRFARVKKSADEKSSRPVPVCLIFVVSSGDEAVAAVAGEASFELREVRAMHREVKTMRKELADAGEAGVERARLDAFLRKFAEFVEGPPPPDPKRARSRSPVPNPDPAEEAPAADEGADGADGADGAEAAGDEAAGDEAAPPMTTAEDVSLLSALEAFASPDGGYCGVNPALCAILHPALAKRRARRP